MFNENTKVITIVATIGNNIKAIPPAPEKKLKL